MLKALKKMFGKSEAEQLAPSPVTSSPAPISPVADDSQDRHAQVSAAPSASVAVAESREEPAKAEPVSSAKPKSERPRRERAPKPPVVVWNLADFVVEPQEGKTRFHDFDLAPELMHAIQDLGFPYCTPIQAEVLGFTLKGQDAIGRAQTGTGKTAAFLISIISQLTQTPPPKER